MLGICSERVKQKPEIILARFSSSEWLRGKGWRRRFATRECLLYRLPRVPARPPPARKRAFRKPPGPARRTTAPDANSRVWEARAQSGVLATLGPILGTARRDARSAVEVQHDHDFSVARAQVPAFHFRRCAPLSQEESSSIARSQGNPFPPDDPLHATYCPFDPTDWKILTSPLPQTYLDFLCWSDGGSFFNEDRGFEPFLSCSELRQYLIGYRFPRYLPGSLPFSLDGNGNAYVFDMREKANMGEYPVLFVGLGNLRYGQAVNVGRRSATFLVAEARLEGIAVPRLRAHERSRRMGLRPGKPLAAPRNAPEQQLTYVVVERNYPTARLLVSACRPQAPDPSFLGLPGQNERGKKTFPKKFRANAS
jgi:hypothetical protein